MVDGQDGANIGVNHETGQGAQQMSRVIGRRCGAFGVCDCHNPINVWIVVRQASQALLQRLDKRSGG